MSHPYSDTTLLGTGAVLVAFAGYELAFAYRTGSVHRGRAELGPITREKNPAAFWRNVCGGVFLLVLGAAVAAMGAAGLISRWLSN